MASALDLVEVALEECAGAAVGEVHHCRNGCQALCVEVSSELQDQHKHLRNMDAPRGRVAVLPLDVEDQLSVRVLDAVSELRAADAFVDVVLAVVEDESPPQICFYRAFDAMQSRESRDKGR